MPAFEAQDANALQEKTCSSMQDIKDSMIPRPRRDASQPANTPAQSSSSGSSAPGMRGAYIGPPKVITLPRPSQTATNHGVLHGQKRKKDDGLM